jgi:GntR family transcriptional regulator, transcriptional repressor for pyruvate dehydrogenase complex
MESSNKNAAPTRRIDGLRQAHAGSRFDQKPKKTARLIAQHLVGEIMDRGLPAGSPLPSERQMLTDYGVARGTLREALRFLEMQGVISIKTGPGGGPIVEMPDSRNLASTIALLLQFRGARFRTIIETRLAIEPLLAANAASNVTPDLVEQLEASIRRMRDHIEDEGLFLRENELFHEIIAAASGNELFSLLISSLGWITDGTVLGVQYSPAQRDWVIGAHRSIFHAIAVGDEAQAAATMRVHLGDFAAFLEVNYPRAMEQRLRWSEVDQ